MVVEVCGALEISKIKTPNGLPPRCREPRTPTGKQATPSGRTRRSVTLMGGRVKMHKGDSVDKLASCSDRTYKQ
ncbi:MAG: hypothetical protein HWQ41_26015 [Nostoc sp. NOS(2021)]|uniref:hypothetical protein n=1 Tax=Nostoc sp. NOS(2021) TaxID=2815407 RepID=UPI0025F56382|nr:hypothetical protein [Nostoc sp. NOS(2021)]MBN3898598.1 hypothetical protein [Nostoc sp. NOS(2021)]